jgi:hypothetical protein
VGGVRPLPAELVLTIPSEFEDFGFFNTAPPTRASSGTRTATYRMAEAFDAGTNVYLDADARLCCLHHASEARDGVHNFWNPGECLPLSSTIMAAPSQGLGGLTRAVLVGSRGRWQAPTFLLPSSYSCDVVHARGALGRAALGGSPKDAVRGVPVSVMAQVPGWWDAVIEAQYTVDDDGVGYPQVEATRVDAQAWLEVTTDQAPTNDVLTVGAHPITAPYPTSTPYSALAGAAMTVPAAAAGSSTVLEWEDVAVGWGAAYDFSSSRVAAGTDPGYDPSGAAEHHLATFTWSCDFTYWVRIRFPEPDEEPVLRWRQRDDGRGVGSARRGRYGSSRQSSKRHRGGYRFTPLPLTA